MITFNFYDIHYTGNDEKQVFRRLLKVTRTRVASSSQIEMHTKKMKTNSRAYELVLLLQKFKLVNSLARQHLPSNVARDLTDNVAVNPTSFVAR